ncbi:hypothetical protein CQA4T8M7_05220 [Sphaerotilus natans]|nr:hypothetical protein CQA4T8M7_05220 [Sphaerotilus natans]
MSCTHLRYRMAAGQRAPRHSEAHALFLPLYLESAMDALARWIYPLICLLSLLLVIATAAIDHQGAYPDGNAGGQVGTMLQTLAAQPSAG